MDHQLISILESVLGKSKKTSGDNLAFNCPFCHHYKKKLEINLYNQHYNCWICNNKGRSLVILFRKLNADRNKISTLAKLLDVVIVRPKKTTTDTTVLSLPDEYKPLWVINNKSPEYRNAVYYLKSRGLRISDILRYRIGYCSSGPYSGKIIIPSYDANGSLNYFVGRSYYPETQFKHKNPKASKDVVGFELHINWSQPIILTEGAFDAIAIRRNAIPLFGKTIPNKLKKRIVDQGVQDIYICLDSDAREHAIKAADYFMANGITVYLVDITDKDPSDMGFQDVNELIESTPALTKEKLLQSKILCKL